MENLWSFLKKLKTELAYDPAVPLIVYVSGKNENFHLKRYVHLNVHSSIFTICQYMKAHYVSINRWKDKEDVVYTHSEMEYYPAIP